MSQNPQVHIDEETGLEIRPWPARFDHDASLILAAATGEGTGDAGQRAIDLARAGGDDRVFGAVLNGQLVGVFTLLRDGLANELGAIAVREDHRRSGIGRLLVRDAVVRSGRRPLVTETDEQGLSFYKACGFHMVGRRKHPSGVFRYRVAAHAPALRPAGGGSDALRAKIGATKSPHPTHEG